MAIHKITRPQPSRN